MFDDYENADKRNDDFNRKRHRIKPDRDGEKRRRAAAAELLGTTIQGIHELPDEVRRRVLDRMSPMGK